MSSSDATSHQDQPWIDITSSNPYPLHHFVIPSHYSLDLSSVLIPHGLVQDRIVSLAHRIVADTDGPLTCICVLKGGHQFFADLVGWIKRLRGGKSMQMSLEFLRVKSYVGMEAGEVSISLSEEECRELKGRNVLIVEDIVDTGNTMLALLKKLGQYEPASVKVASLLLKKTTRSRGYVPDYVGFAIPDLFVVGYCLDYNEYFRDLDHICVISEHGKEAYAQ
ncbi:uncharacterized protein VTP21DRAFT_3651 [Calcarisporiella thermophila]|uniref:uncharacterized protein n=1 Tax=Calcarisporiella thermophila TaxID=911321 RepID=UPI003744A96E